MQFCFEFHTENMSHKMQDAIGAFYNKLDECQDQESARALLFECADLHSVRRSELAINVMQIKPIMKAAVQNPAAYTDPKTGLITIIIFDTRRK